MDDNQRFVRLEHEIFGNGRPGIESRMKTYVDSKADLMESRQNERHSQNTRKIDRLSWLVGIGVGIIITLNAVLLGKLH